MLSSLIYLILNVLCVTVLLAKRYHRTWPACVVAQCLTAWQIGVAPFADGTVRTTAMRLWTIGECLLLVATLAAVSEALWQSMRKMSLLNRALSFGGMLLCAGSIAAYVYGSPSGDAQFFAYRSMFFLAMAIVASGGFLVGVFHLHEWPRAAWSQLGIYAVLMVSHVAIVDWSHWHASRLGYRTLEALVCVAFVVNAQFLSSELAAVRRFRDAVPRLRNSWPIPTPQSECISTRNATPSPTALRARYYRA